MSWTWVSVPAAIAVVVQCIAALNQMTGRTDHRVRLVYLGFLLSAAAGALAPMYGLPAQPWDAAMLVLIAVYLRVNRRKTYLIPAAPQCSST